MPPDMLQGLLELKWKHDAVLTMCMNILTYHCFSPCWFACNKTGKQMIAEEGEKHHDHNPYRCKQIW